MMTRLAIGVLLLLAAVVLVGPSCQRSPPGAQRNDPKELFEDAYTREGHRASPHRVARATRQVDDID
jgi:hypothetical protein